MSQEQVEIVRRANAAFHHGDLEGAAEPYARDVVWRDLEHAPDAPEVVHGVEAVRRIWTDWLEVLPDLRADILEYIDAGTAVVCVTHWSGTGDGSGVPIDLYQADVFEFAEGKIVEATFGYRSREDALEAVKQREPKTGT